MCKKVISVLMLSVVIFCALSLKVYGKDDKGFNFAVMGCLHFGVSQDEDYQLAISTIRQNSSRFILFLGGMVDPMGEEPIEALWHRFSILTGEFKAPVYDIPGSCRLLSSLSYPKDRVDLLTDFFKRKYKRSHYSFEYRNNLFVCLDSTELFDKNGNIPAETGQMNFLKENIASASKYDNIFITINRSPWVDDGRQEWFKVVHPLIKNKVKFVFGANTHYLSLKEIDGVKYITSGSPSGYVNPDENKISLFSFLAVYVNKDNVSIKVVPLIKSVPIDRITNFQEDGSFFNSPVLESTYFQRVRDYELTSIERLDIVQPQRVVETLKIQSGMKILDIGAGTGLFSFLFAKALKGTGMVFATDVDAVRVAYMDQKKREGGFGNVVPVLVNSQGLDGFYKQHIFDIIFLSGVYDSIHHAGDYLKQLSPSLKKETGRLYIIHGKNVSDFSPIEFRDYKRTIVLLSRDMQDFPVFQRLSPQVQDFVRSWKGEDIPTQIRKRITEDFNTMLSDRRLWSSLADYYSAKKFGGWAPLLSQLLFFEDVPLATWLIVNLDSEGIFDAKEKDMPKDETRQLRALNRILLKGIFKMDVLAQITTRHLCVEKNSVIKTLEAAGYQFVREYDFLTHDYFLEFKRES